MKTVMTRGAGSRELRKRPMRLSVDAFVALLGATACLGFFLGVAATLGYLCQLR